MGRINLPSGGGGNPLMGKKRHTVKGLVEGLFYKCPPDSRIKIVGESEDGELLFVSVDDYGRHTHYLLAISIDSGSTVFNLNTAKLLGMEPQLVTTDGNEIVCFSIDKIIKIKKNNTVVSKKKLSEKCNITKVFNGFLYGYRPDGWNEPDKKTLLFKLDMEGNIVAKYTMYDIYAGANFWVNGIQEKALIFTGDEDRQDQSKIFDFKEKKMQKFEKNNHRWVIKDILSTNNGDTGMVDFFHIGDGYNTHGLKRASPILLAGNIFFFKVVYPTDERTWNDHHNAFVVFIDANDLKNYRIETLSTEQEFYQGNLFYFSEKKKVLFFRNGGSIGFKSL